MTRKPRPHLEFGALFEAGPTPSLVLSTPDLEIVAVNTALLRTTGLRESSDLVGLKLFEAFPDNGVDASVGGEQRLRAALDQVVATGEPAVIPVYKYDIKVQGTGGFEERWWSQVLAPVTGPSGLMEYVIIQVEDVTNTVGPGTDGLASDQVVRDQKAAIVRLRQSNVALARETQVRRVAEERLRQAASLDGYRVKLNDALRPLSDPVEVQKAALRVLADHLEADHAYLAEIDHEAGVYDVSHTFARDDRAALVGRYPLDSYGEISERLGRGESVVAPDVSLDGVVNEAARSAMLSHGIWSFISAPVVKDGRWLAILNVLDSTPREWDEADVMILEETAERTWTAIEKARADEQIRHNARSFESLVHNVPFGMYVADADFRIFQASTAAQGTFGLDGLIGMDLADALRAIWREPFATEAIGRFRHTLETGEPYVSTETVEARADRDVQEAYDWRLERIAMPDGRYGVVCYYYDLTERRQLEGLLRHKQERQEFLLDLSDALQSVVDPQEIIETACRLLGERLGVNRVVFADVDENYFIARASYVAGVPPLPDKPFALADFAEAFRSTFGNDGEYTVTDVATHEPFTELEREAYGKLQIAALARVPLLKGGRWVGALSVHQAVPRVWSEHEIGLLREVAYRIWAAAERAQADEELRRLNESLEQQVAERTEELSRSETRFRVAFEAGPVAACITAVNGETVLDVNRSFERFTGYLQEEVVGRTVAELRLWWDEPTDDVRQGSVTGQGYRDLERRVVSKSGGVKDVLVSSAMVSLNGEPAWLTMFIDNTAQKRRREAVNRAIQEAMTEATWFGKSVVERLTMVKGDTPQQSTETPLTPREQQVLTRLAKGHSDKVIAEELGIATRTVRNHVTNIYGKLSVRSRSQAIVWAQEKGIVG